MNVTSFAILLDQMFQNIYRKDTQQKAVKLFNRRKINWGLLDIMKKSPLLKIKWTRNRNAVAMVQYKINHCPAKHLCIITVEQNLVDKKLITDFLETVYKII